MSEYVEEVESLVADRQEVVTYGWLSDNFGISAETSKRAIFEAFQTRPDKYDAVFCVIGATKADSMLQVQLVLHEQLTECLKSYGSVSSFCLYCLGPKNSISQENLANSSRQEISHLLHRMRLGSAAAHVKTEDTTVKLEEGLHRASDEGASRKSASKAVDDSDLMSPSKRLAKDRDSKRGLSSQSLSSRKKPKVIPDGRTSSPASLFEKVEAGTMDNGEELADHEKDRDKAKESGKQRSSVASLSRGRKQTKMTSFFTKKT